MAFDPNKYLAEKTGQTSVAQGGSFNPDKYLAEKTGQAPVATAELPHPQSTYDKFWGDTRPGFDENMAPNAPHVNIPSGYDAVNYLTDKGYFPDNKYAGAAAATAIDAAPILLGLLGAKGAKGAKALPPEVAAPKLIEAPAVAPELGAKPNAQAITEATKRLGAEPSPGMLSNNEVVRRLEDSLSQSPTIGGWLTKKKIAPVQEALASKAKGLVADASPLSPFETGEKAKQVMSGEIEKRFSEPKRLFDDLRQYTQDIPSTERSTKAVSKNILDIPDVGIEGSPDAGLARMVTKTLEKNPSADQIKTLRTMVGKKAAAIERQGGDASGIWQIYDKVGRLEENTIKRGAISSARTKPEGETIAKGMLGQLKSAKQGYSSEMNNLGDLSEATGLGRVRSPEQLKEKLNSIQSERLQEKLLPLDDVRAGKQVFEYSPETADLLRRARLRDVSDRASRGGDFSARGLVQAMDKVNPETEQLLFGKNKATLDDLRTVLKSLPEKTGQSGTPQGHSYLFGDMLNPYAQARDLAKYFYYRTHGGPPPPTRPVGPMELESMDPTQAVILDLTSRLRNKPQELPSAADNEKKKKTLTAGQ
jgi:hypothetical protein